jgi:hypothetical protein
VYAACTSNVETIKTCLQNLLNGVIQFVIWLQPDFRSVEAKDFIEFEDAFFSAGL